MVIYSGMTDGTAPRAFSWIWFIRIAQILLTAIVIALAALNAYNWRDCSVPGKIAWNIACGAISFLVLIYFLLATGPGKIFKLLPWLVWGQIALDALMFIFWIAAAGTSKLNCKDYCKSCSGSPYVDWNDMFCYCFGDTDVNLSDFLKRDMSPAPQGLGGLLEPRRSRYSGGSGSSSGRSGKNVIVALRTAGDAIMTVLFFVTLVATIWWFFSQRRSHGTAAPTIPRPTQAEVGNAGFPMSPNQQQQPVPGYAPQTGEQYPQGQPQPQQPVYDPSHPQGQYPSQPAYQTGAPAQY